MRHESFTSAASPTIKRHALIFGDGYQQQKINLHESGKEFVPKARNVQLGSADLCFLTAEPIEIVRDRLVEFGLPLEPLAQEPGMEGGQHTEDSPQGAQTGDYTNATVGAIVNRIGARGMLKSVYLRDPDGNLVEISNYQGE
ncbi:hypothetical protein MMC17_003564 [Xylographa soralifera]|nr:hypothetical protein [Xylographa soralifera]